MLPEKHRLHLRFERARVESEACNYSSPLFTFLYAKLPDRAGMPSRFAFVVSKRISKKAVERNLVRRQFVSKLLPLLDKLELGMDVIVLAKPYILKPNNHFDEVFQKSLVDIKLLPNA